MSASSAYDKLMTRCDAAVAMLDTIQPQPIPEIWCPPIVDLIRGLVQANDDLLEELEATKRELASVLGEGDSNE